MSPEKAAAIWRLALVSLEQGCPVILIFVLESIGSSPGRQGFFMVINARGETDGSIGGGVMEHKFTVMARQQLEENAGAESHLRRQIHDDAAVRDRSGMICSGQQTLFFYHFRDTDKSTLGAMIGSIGACSHGTLRLCHSGISFSPEVPPHDYSYVHRSDTDWLYEEKTGYKQRLFIVGAGHCGLALSNLMRAMDFYITVLDHRPELSTYLSNHAAHEKVFVEDYAALSAFVPAGVVHHYVVIMTLGYRTDDIALRALIDKDLRYLGLLGSKAKTARMLETYRQEGMAEDRLLRIHTPAGLAIHSQTPEEIAISIAAELIDVKNGG